MNDELYNELVASVREAGAILRDEVAAPRRSDFEDPDVAAIRDELGLSQTKFAALLGIRNSRRRCVGPVDHYLRVCEARDEEPGRPFSGKLNLRLGPDLHRAAAVAAAAEGESLNAWLTKLVESAAAPMVVRERPPTTRGHMAKDRKESR